MSRITGLHLHQNGRYYYRRRKNGKEKWTSLKTKDRDIAIVKLETLRDKKKPGTKKSQSLKNESSLTRIYLMRCGDLTKIGHARNPRQRQAMLQTGNPLPVDLVWQSNILPDEFERVLHERFHKKRVRGEWFRLNTNDIEWIMREGGGKQFRK